VTDFFSETCEIYCEILHKTGAGKWRAVFWTTLQSMVSIFADGRTNMRLQRTRLSSLTSSLMTRRSNTATWRATNPICF